MSPEKEESGEGANDMNYPSPGAEAIDAGPFYHASARDATQERQEQPQQHDEHAPERTQGKEQEQQNEMHQADPATPQHSARPPNIEELQLAAQLGQGLAGTPIIPSAADPNMNVEDPNLRNIMPHPEHDQQQHHTSYIQDTPSSESMVTHGLAVSVGPPLAPHYAIGGDNIPPRKRSKVSRACDECRRKKIKCDAQTDTGDAPCSSCARSNLRCLFSRVPQKRGPSKGYIKELADRIHSIENKLESEGGLTQEDLSGLFGDRPHRPSNAGEDSSRKRPYSSISGGGDFESPPSARHTPWESGAEPRPIQPATQENHGVPYSTAVLAPPPSAIRADATPSKPPVAPMDVSMADAEEVEVDEGVLQDYLATIQTLYPILPNSKTRVQALLATCPSSVRTAFVNALLAVAQSSSGNVKLANSLLSDWESSDAPCTLGTNIVHAQTLLLLVIDADWRGSPTLPSLLARAVALAYSMKLWRYTAIQPGTDVDSDDNLCIRIWWSLVLMDRWHAVGTGKPVQIPDGSVVVPPGLDAVVGETCYFLIRLSKSLSRISHVISTLPPGASTADGPVAAILTDYVENYREDLPTHVEPVSHPLVHLAYWHCRLAVMLLTPTATCSEILWPTKELINLLTENSDMRSPLANHFGFLVAMALSNLSRISDSSREEAVQITKEILDKPGGVWDAIRDKLSDQMRPASSSGDRDAANLQHLADLATAHQGIGNGEETAAPSLTHGYLNIA